MASVLAVLLLMIFPPLGIFVMFKFTNWNDNWKKAIAVISLIIWIAAIVTTMNEEVILDAQGMRALSSFCA